MGQLNLRGTRNVCTEAVFNLKRQLSDISSDATALRNRDKKLQYWRDLL